MFAYKKYLILGITILNMASIAKASDYKKDSKHGPSKSVPAKSLPPKPAPSLKPSPVPSLTPRTAVVADPCSSLPTDKLINGSFETLNSSVGIDNGVTQSKIISLKTWDIFQNVAGWTSVDKGGIELWGGGFNGFNPTNGNVLMEIKGNSPNVISQDFCATQGQKTISLDVAARTGLFGDNLVNLAIDGKQVLHIDPAHYFFKNYFVNVNLNKGKHTLTLSSETGTNPSMGGLIDNINLQNCGYYGCPHRGRTGVATILMALSEIDFNDAKQIIGDEIKVVSAVAKPKILFVRSVYNSGESLTDFNVIPQILISQGYDVTSIDESIAGLSTKDVDGYDVIWFNNPGYPPQSAVTLQTLYSQVHSQKSGVVLSGDDMSSNQYVNMSELTLLTYGNNGTQACGSPIDNNVYSGRYVVNYQGQEFTYGNDIDQDTLPSGYLRTQKNSNPMQAIMSGKVVITATATTNIKGCGLKDIPVIIDYKL